MNQVNFGIVNVGAVMESFFESVERELKLVLLMLVVVMAFAPRLCCWRYRSHNKSRS